MVRCWYMNQLPGNKCQVLSSLDTHELTRVTGVIYYKVDPDDYRDDVDLISRKYGYKREDTVGVYPASLDNYEEQIKKFNTEHQHPDEEVRFALKGKGYFEVRSKNDQWIRIEVVPGDFLILPSGIYHRFFFHEEEQGIVFLRLFQDDAPYTIKFRKNADQNLCTDINQERVH